MGRFTEAQVRDAAETVKARDDLHGLNVREYYLRALEGHAGRLRECLVVINNHELVAKVEDPEIRAAISLRFERALASQPDIEVIARGVADASRYRRYPPSEEAVVLSREAEFEAVSCDCSEGAHEFESVQPDIWCAKALAAQYLIEQEVDRAVEGERYGDGRKLDRSRRD